MKLTVIMPVYNVEHYVSRAIESVLNQTFSDFDLIIVDDGSKDNSLNICKEYALNDSRVRVYSQANAGVSTARNFALDQIITTEFVTFIDSDDWIEKDLYEQSIESMDKFHLDLCISGYMREKDDSSYFDLVHNRSACILSKDEALKEIFNCNIFSGTLCDTFFKFSVISGLRHNEKLAYLEDFLLKVQCIKKCNRIGYMPLFKYHYTDRVGSASNRYTKRNFDILKASRLAAPNDITNAADVLYSYELFYTRNVIQLSSKLFQCDNGRFRHIILYSQRYIRKRIIKILLSNNTISQKIYAASLTLFSYDFLIKIRPLMKLVYIKFMAWMDKI